MKAHHLLNVFFSFFYCIVPNRSQKIVHLSLPRCVGKTVFIHLFSLFSYLLFSPSTTYLVIFSILKIMIFNISPLSMKFTVGVQFLFYFFRFFDHVNDISFYFQVPKFLIINDVLVVLSLSIEMIKCFFLLLFFHEEIISLISS